MAGLPAFGAIVSLVPPLFVKGPSSALRGETEEPIWFPCVPSVMPETDLFPMRLKELVESIDAVGPMPSTSDSMSLARFWAMSVFLRSGWTPA